MTEDRVIQRGGFSVGNALIALGVLALAAILAFVLLSNHRNQALRTDAVTSAASSLAASTASR
jgi:type II secretory pathway component PulJ